MIVSKCYRDNTKTATDGKFQSIRKQVTLEPCIFFLTIQLFLAAFPKWQDLKRETKTVKALYRRSVFL